MKRILVLASLALFLAASPQDPGKDLKSKDFETRKGAVTAIVSSPDKNAEKNLVTALKDDDWEIVEMAAKGLGELGPEVVGKNGVKALTKMALEAPVRRLRKAAAEALAQIDPEEAAKAFTKKLGGKTSLPASEALIHIAAESEERKAPKALKKAADKGKEYAVRVAAARAMMIAGSVDRSESLEHLLEHEAAGVRAAALDVVLESAVPADLERVEVPLMKHNLSDVLERRALSAAHASLWVHEDSERKAKTEALLNKLLGDESPRVARRAPRLVAKLVKAPVDPSGETPYGKEGKYEASDLRTWLTNPLAHTSADVRAAAAGALRVMVRDNEDEDARAMAQTCAAEDDDARTRRAALFAVAVGISKVLEEDADEELVERRALLVEWLGKRLKEEKDARAREDIAVSLGFKGNEAGLPALAGALADSDPWVQVCAAVSIGKTRLEAGVELLAPHVKAEDWRLRGAAVVGLGSLYQKEAVQHIIGSVEDEEPAIARTAIGYLEAYSKRKDTDPNIDAWQQWWVEKEKSTTLIDPESAEDKAEKYGYSTNWEQIYGGLDVIVFESRGDHIQKILDKLEVQHRMTQAAKLTEDAMRPAGVFVSNCTGEMEKDDVERLAWFVRCGGYIFGSCWAVTHTVDLVYPGVLMKYETSGEVMDKVGAAPCHGDSPLLTGVFEEGVEPIYSLVGAHLIEVTDPERAQVLVDSPECAENWGEGNMAAWFPAGHGVILDSVNHFEEQGLADVQGLKKPEHRQAYAVDHMGLSWEALRESRDEKYWGSNTDAGRKVLDLSVFRLITNFVRQKRIGGRIGE